MDESLPLLALIATASISIGRPVAAEWRLAGPLLNPFATDTDVSDAALVRIPGKGGGSTSGMSGGRTTGGMGGGGTAGGMGSGGTTGGNPS